MSPWPRPLASSSHRAGRSTRFDPGGLELAWNDKVICQTSRGKEYGRVVQPNHAIADAELAGRLKRVVRRRHRGRRRAGSREHGDEAKRAMLSFREADQEPPPERSRSRPRSSFDGSRLVFSYGSEGRHRDAPAAGGALAAPPPARRAASASARASSRGSAAGTGSAGRSSAARASRRTSSRSPCGWRRIRISRVSSGRITGLCGRLRCCLAYEHPLYRSFRDRAPRVGAQGRDPAGSRRREGLRGAEGRVLGRVRCRDGRSR